MADILDRVKDKLEAWANAQADSQTEQSSIQSEIAKANARRFQDAFAKAKQFGVDAAGFAKSGPGATLRALSGADDPFALMHQAEATVGLGKDIATHVAGQANAMLQSVSPVDLNKVPGMKGVFPEVPAGKGVETFGRNIPIVSDLLNPLIDNFHRDIAGLGNDATLSQKIAHGGLPAIGQTLKQIGQPIISLVTSRDEDGQPLDAGSAARKLEEASMLVRGGGEVAGGLLGKAFSLAKLEGDAPKMVKNAPSTGEIESAMEVQKLRKAEAGRQLALRAEKIRAQQGLKPDVDLNAGTSQVPLDSRGRASMQELAPKVQGLDKLYHSDTVRAHESAGILSRPDASTIIDRGGPIPTEVLHGLNAPAMGALEGQPAEIGNSLFEHLAQTAPETQLPGAGPLSTEPGTSFADWSKGMLSAMQSLRDEYTTKSLQGEEPRIGALTHSKNLELAQSWIDAGSPTESEGFDVQDYINHKSGPPSSMYHYAPDSDGAWRMTEAEDTSQPGIYLIRHGETPFDGEIDGNTSPTIGTPRIVPYSEYDAAREALPDVMKAQLSAEGILPLDLFKEATNKVFAEPQARDAALDFIRSGDPISLAVTKVMQDPETSSSIVRDLMDTRGASFEDVQKAFAGAYENTKSHSGAVLGHLGNTVQSWMDELDYTAQHGNLEQAANAMKTLKDLRNANEIASGRIGNGQALAGWQKVANILQKTERLRIASMISPIRTAVGIAQSQFGLLGTDFMDAAFTSLANGFKKPMPGMADGPAFSSTAANADLISLSQAVVNRLPSKLFRNDLWNVPKEVLDKLGLQEGGASTVDTLLNSVPTIKRQLGEGLLFDTNEHMFGRSMGLMAKAASEAGGWQGLLKDPSTWISKQGEALGHIKDIEDINFSKTPGKALYNVTNGLLDFKLYPNRWQESFFRKLAFDARYRANLKAAGLTYEDALEQLNRKEIKQSIDESGRKSFDSVPIDPALREALADATVHSLRQTYAYTPEGGLFGSVLAANRKMTQSIFPTSIVPGITFPRAMINNMMWQIHHSPLNIADIFTKEFKDTFNGLNDQLDPNASRNASRKIGEALTGLTIFNAALHMAAGGELGVKVNGQDTTLKNGPKPWLWQLGHETDAKGQPKFIDVSSLQPFNNLWTMADHMMGWATGRGSTVTPEELASQIMNTNVGDVPMFTWDQTLRNLGSKNPDTLYKALTEDFGRYIGGFGSVLKGMREEFAAIPPQFRTTAMLAGPNRWLNLDTKTGFTRHYQASALPDALLAPIGSSETLPKIDVDTGKLNLERHPVQNLLKSERQPMTGIAELLNSTPGYDINNLVKHYDDPHATMLVRQAYGTILNNPNFKVGDEQFQVFARGLAQLHNPAMTELFLKQYLPALHQASEQLAMLWDASKDAETRKVSREHGRPVHFAKELADKLNIFKSDETQKLIENFVRNGQAPGVLQ